MSPDWRSPLDRQEHIQRLLLVWMYQGVYRWHPYGMRDREMSGSVISPNQYLVQPWMFLSSTWQDWGTPRQHMYSEGVPSSRFVWNMEPVPVVPLAFGQEIELGELTEALNDLERLHLIEQIAVREVERVGWSSVDVFYARQVVGEDAAVARFTDLGIFEARELALDDTSLDRRRSVCREMLKWMGHKRMRILLEERGMSNFLYRHEFLGEPNATVDDLPVSVKELHEAFDSLSACGLAHGGPNLVGSSGLMTITPVRSRIEQCLDKYSGDPFLMAEKEKAAERSSVLNIYGPTTGSNIAMSADGGINQTINSGTSADAQAVQTLAQVVETVRRHEADLALGAGQLAELREAVEVLEAAVASKQPDQPAVRVAGRAIARTAGQLILGAGGNGVWEAFKALIGFQ